MIQIRMKYLNSLPFCTEIFISSKNLYLYSFDVSVVATYALLQTGIRFGQTVMTPVVVDDDVWNVINTYLPFIPITYTPSTIHPLVQPD